MSLIRSLFFAVLVSALLSENLFADDNFNKDVVKKLDLKPDGESVYKVNLLSDSAIILSGAFISLALMFGNTPLLIRVVRVILMELILSIEVLSPTTIILLILWLITL
jgi:hypothetical protein